MQITASEMWQVLDSDLHDHHQNTDRGKIFCKNDVKFPPVELQRLGQSRPLKLTKATVASYFCPTNIHSISHSLLLKAVQWTNSSVHLLFWCHHQPASAGFADHLCSALTGRICSFSNKNTAALCMESYYSCVFHHRLQTVVSLSYTVYSLCSLWSIVIYCPHQKRDISSFGEISLNRNVMWPYL